MKTGMRVRITLFSILCIMYYNTFRCAVFIEGVHARKARPLLNFLHLHQIIYGAFHKYIIVAYSMTFFSKGICITHFHPAVSHHVHSLG